jgi:1-deoxy-D-xylulose-5-phosphate synthase
MSLLSKINGPEDVKALSVDQLLILAEEIRKRILAVTSANGGHVGPNLGVVELTIALHRVFSTPSDQFVFDVAHQGYVHKLLTGRNDARFDNLRKTGGCCGFLMREESRHDAYGAGHAGTALSAALGLAAGRDKSGSNDHIVALIGDASLTCGITMEALNNLVHHSKRLIVILNDNEWSISRNVGAIAKYLSALITQPAYQSFHHKMEEILEKMPGGHAFRNWVSKVKRETKDFLSPVPSSMFENYGLRYIGPIDGHDLESLINYLEFAKHSDEPVLLHVLTKKGKGFPAAIEHPERFHGTSPFDPLTGTSKPGKPGTPANYQDVFGSALLAQAKQRPEVLAITAAMSSGTGLTEFSKELPDQFFDVGIAEEHAVLFAAGLAIRGMKPVCAIYSTFLQRAYDPIVHDVCLQKLPVLFCMDRAGLSPNDGPTHHGLFDISYLRCIPNTTVMQPKDEDELTDMVHTGLLTDSPTFIRYPRGTAVGVEIKETPLRLQIGKAQVLRDEGDTVVLWALGPMVQDALYIADVLAEKGVAVSVVNARFAKPIDETLLDQHADRFALIVTLEDHAVTGGFGSAVLESLSNMKKSTPVERIGWPDIFVAHASSVDDLRRQNGIDRASLIERLEARIQACVAI